MRAAFLAAVFILAATAAFANPKQSDPNNTNVNVQGQQQGQQQDQVNGDITTTDFNSNTANYSSNVYSNSDHETAHSAYAPALSAGADTCLGSTSVGGQGAMFGFSVGTNWTDENCENIRSAKALNDMGQVKAALYVMCLANGGRNVAALAAAGFDCGPVVKAASDKKVAELISKSQQVADASFTEADADQPKRHDLYGANR